MHWNLLTLLLHMPWMAPGHPWMAYCESPPSSLPSPPRILSSLPHLLPSLGSFVCSHSGHILEIDHQRMAVQHIRRLLPTQSPGVPLTEKQNFSLGRWAPRPWGKWYHVEVLMPALSRVRHCHQQPQRLFCHMCCGL